MEFSILFIKRTVYILFSKLRSAILKPYYENGDTLMTYTEDMVSIMCADRTDREVFVWDIV